MQSQMNRKSELLDSEVKYISSLFGGFWDLDVKDFCYMTNPYFPPPELLSDMGARLQDLVKAYPSTNSHISSLLAEPLGLTQQELVVANGASELISVVTSRFVKNLAVPVPTFNEYINRAEALGRSVSPYITSGDFELNPDAFIQHVKTTGANSALFIQPNNPTGTFISKENMRYLLESLRMNFPRDQVVSQTFARVLHQRGLLRYGQGFLEGAIEDWRRVLGMQPGHRQAKAFLKAAETELKLRRRR